MQPLVARGFWLVPVFSCVVIVALATGTSAAEHVYWPQFRGPGSTGIAAANDDPPIELTESELKWKLAIPYGHGSPCIWADQIFLSGYDPQKKQLRIVSIDRTKGELQWEQIVVADKIEPVHRTSSPATATIATDGERIYVYFGSTGLLCYDVQGESLWEYRLPVPQTPFGSGTSPIVSGEYVLLCRDAQDDSFLVALDRKTGREIWKQTLPSGLMGRLSYATPIVWRDEIILHRTGEVSGYQLNDGKRVWWFSVAGSGTSTPVTNDETLFVNAWNNFGEPELRVDLPSFPDLLKAHDKNADKKISKEEFPADLAMARRPEVADDVPGAQFRIKPFFDKLDANKDDHLTSLEWLAMRLLLSSMSSEHALVAIRAGGKGDVTKKNVVWKESRGIAEVPSLLLHDGRVYMVKDGGIVTCLNASNGDIIYRERLGGPGAYHASPILAAGRIYIASTNGVITVLAAGENPKVLAKRDLKEPIFATPAVLDDCLYVRSHQHLYAFARE